VLVAHGDHLARAGLRAVLEPAFHVVADAASGAAALDAARLTLPDVIVSDVALPGCDGVLLAREIRAATGPHPTKTVLLVGSDAAHAVVPALRAGAVGLVAPDAAAEALIDAVRAAAAGRAVLGAGVAEHVVDALLARPEHLDVCPEPLTELTAREAEVMGLVACGLSNREIAARLVISAETVKTHVGRTMRKLHAHDRAQLVVIAYQCGLVTAGDPAGRHSAIRRIAGRAHIGLAA
jgi:DNA-binding NarL/FixJ family response regulator